jgi:hypothetical protein
MLQPQFIREKSVVLPQKEYDALMERLDDLDDIRLYEAAKRRKQTFIPAEEAFAMLDAKRQSK